MSSQAFPTELPDFVAQAENLPSLPAVALEVLRLTQDENSTIEDLANVLQSDPVLSAKLLKLSNSSLFNMGQEVTTLERATMVLGMKTVKLMSLSFSLASSMPQSGVGNFDFPAYWQRSLVAGVAGRSLGRLTGSPFGDEAFLCGLLSHIGQLVLSQCMEEDYSEVLEAAGDCWPSVQLEERMLGFSHADIAGALLTEWGLPRTVAVPVSFMYRLNKLPADIEGDLREFTFLMAVTGLVVQVLCDTDAEAGSTKAFEKLYELCEKRFHLSQREMDAFLIGLEGGIRETAEMLNVDLPEGLDNEKLVAQARGQIVNISLDTTADLRSAERRADDLSVRNKELVDKAHTDKLTQLANRAAFDEALAKEIDARMSGRIPRCLGLIMIDVDKFKVFNDTYGHQAGDAVLEMVGVVLKRMTRKGDLPARYGGEEFAVILPATTPVHLRTVADRIRAAIEAETVVYEGQELRVTASFGAACVEEATSEEDAEGLIKTADSYLYKAKENGRNRCEVYSQTVLPER